MKIGIIVYSQTGHTLSVAVALKEELARAGHTVNLERVEIFGPERPGDNHVPLKTSPKIERYDALIFGSPVRGGVLAPPMLSYLQQLSSLHGRRVACLVTGFFPPGWGRNQTVAQMRQICETRGAVVIGAESVGWLSLGRKRQIAQVVDSLGRAFQTAP